jgi:hypothetical protein
MVHQESIRYAAYIGPDRASHASDSATTSAKTGQKRGHPGGVGTVEQHFSSACGHTVRVAPMQEDGKKWQIRGEEKWQVRVQGPRIASSGTKSLYSHASMAAALAEAAQFLQVSQSSFEATSCEGDPAFPAVGGSLSVAKKERRSPPPLTRAPDPAAPTPVDPPVQYKVVAEAILKHSADYRSVRIGTLAVGDVVTVFQQQRMGDGRVRVECRCKETRGWTSLVASDGTKLLELLSSWLLDDRLIPSAEPLTHAPDAAARAPIPVPEAIAASVGTQLAVFLSPVRSLRGMSPAELRIKGSPGQAAGMHEISAVAVSRKTQTDEIEWSEVCATNSEAAAVSRQEAVEAAVRGVKAMHEAEKAKMGRKWEALRTRHQEAIGAATTDLAASAVLSKQHAEGIATLQRENSALQHEAAERTAREESMLEAMAKAEAGVKMAGDAKDKGDAENRALTAQLATLKERLASAEAERVALAQTKTDFAQTKMNLAQMEADMEAEGDAAMKWENDAKAAQKAREDGAVRAKAAEDRAKGLESALRESEVYRSRLLKQLAEAVDPRPGPALSMGATVSLEQFRAV